MGEVWSEIFDGTVEAFGVFILGYDPDDFAPIPHPYLEPLEYAEYELLEEKRLARRYYQNYQNDAVAPIWPGPHT